MTYTRLLALLLIILFSGQSFCRATDSEDLIVLMQGNDAQFSNLLLDYVETVYEEEAAPKESAKLSLWVDPSIDKKTLPTKRKLAQTFVEYMNVADPSKPSDEAIDKSKLQIFKLIEEGKIKYIEKSVSSNPAKKRSRQLKNRLALRWPNFALSRSHENGALTKLVVEDQNVQFLYPVSSQRREWFSHENIIQGFPNVYHETALTAQWALGVGFHKLIENVVGIQAKGDSYTLEAKLDYWGQLSGTGTFSVGKNGIVQAATIQLSSDNVLINNTITVQTSGEYRDEIRPFLCAQRGRVTQMRGKKVLSDVGINVERIRFNITDADYSSIADCSTPDNETRYRVTDSTGVELVSGAASLEGNTNFNFPLLAINVAVVLILLSLVILKRRNATRLRQFSYRLPRRFC